MDTSSTIAQAIELLQKKSYLDCIALLQEALVETPKNVDMYLYLAYAYAREGLVDDCIEVLERAVDVAPASAKVHYNLGVAYQKQHNITEAKDEFLRALGLDASYAAPKQALDFLATIQAETNRLSDEEVPDNIDATQSKNPIT